MIFNSIHNGCIVTDPDGIITHFNKPYGEFLNLDPESEIGKHCTQSIENSRMHIVAKTGIPEINQSHRINGQDMVVQRIPIKENGKVIAVFGQVMFKDVKDVRKLPDYVPGIPGAQCELAVPLISKNKLVGVLNIESPLPGAFTDEDIEPLMILGRQAAIAIAT